MPDDRYFPQPASGDLIEASSLGSPEAAAARASIPLDVAAAVVARDRALREPICPRCGSGRPCCADLKPDGTYWRHDETCETYVWADEVCGPCAAIMDRETPE